MSFLHPYFLFGLISVAIPVILHFFDLQRPKKILFTNVAFLREVLQQQSSARRLKHWLVLISRILFLSFLVLAFAQPVFFGKNEPSARPLSSIQVYTDNSYSMQQERDQQSLLAISSGLAQQIPSSYPPSSTYRLFNNEFSGNDWPFRTKDSYSDQLTETDYNGQSRTSGQVLSRFAGAFQPEKGEKQDVYILSDFQKKYWNTLIQSVPDSQFVYNLIPLKAEETLNVAIDSIWLQDPFVQAGKANKLNMLVKGYGKGKRETICKLFINDVQISTTNLDVTGGQEMKAVFDFTLDKNGSYKGVISFDDSPVTFDNAFYFTVQTAKEINITHLGQNNDSYLTKVYGNEGLFSRTSYAFSNIDYSVLNRSDLIVVEDCNNPSDVLLQNLKKHLNKGGNLVIFAPLTENWTQWQSFMNGLNVSVKPTALKDSTGKNAWVLQFPDTDQPFFSDVFADKTRKVSEMPFSIPLYETVSAGTTLLRYQQGNPFLTEITSGKGKIYVFSGALRDELSSFQRHSIFVPVMYKIAFMSAGSGGRLYNRTSEKAIVVETNTRQDIHQVHLYNDTLKWLPVQNVLEGSVILDLPDEIKNAGFYELKEEDSLVKTIAINYGREESDIAVIPSEELMNWASAHKNVHVLEAVNQEDFAIGLKSLREGSPLWKYCIILALIFLLVEILLLRFLK